MRQKRPTNEAKEAYSEHAKASRLAATHTTEYNVT